MRLLLRTLAVCLLFLCCGCSTLSRMQEQGQKLGFQQLSLSALGFAYTAFLRVSPGSPTSQTGCLIVYIEGDGRAFLRNGQPANDPSPANPMGFSLALADPAPAVLYLARLGHFNESYNGARFTPYWSEKRFAPEIISSMDEALDQAKARSGAACLHLVGYSGGGGIACLLAARRDDVRSLVTVAGLLDTAWWVETKGLPPLFGSLNPADSVARLASIPQIHFSGTHDTVIPTEMSARFCSLASFTQCRTIPLDFTHRDGWAENWPKLLERYVVPLREATE